jgi:hypothetical protein
MFYLLNSQQYVSVTTVAIFRVMMTTLEEYESSNVASCVAVTQQQLKIIIITANIV